MMKPMRQIWISVPKGEGSRVKDLAEQHQALNVALYHAEVDRQERDVLIFNVPNNTLDDILTRLGDFDSIQVTVHPQDVFPLPNPKSSLPKALTGVSPRSPMEVWLNGLQSVGSWKGFLGYAVAASILVWVALFTDTIYLLIGAMLVAPFAGPAMNFALATAAGDADLALRNLMCYFLSLLLTILVAAALSVVFRQQVVTATMVQISELSFIAVLLPLTAGAVGAHNLSQSANNSLVAGSAVGMLVAASLSPPAGLIGMSIALGRWDMALNGAMLLLMQFCAINLTGALVFHLYGQRPGSIPIRKFHPTARWVSIIASAALLAGILTVQFASTPDFQRSSRAKRATGVAQQVIRDDPRVDLIEANLRFPRPDVDRQNVLLGTVYAEKKPGVDQPSSEIEQELAVEIKRLLLEEGFQVNPLIDVTVLE